MRLKRPPITTGPWYATGPHVQSAVLNEDNYVCEVEGDTPEQSSVNGLAIAALPEVMDRLEWIHELLSSEKSHPMTVHELEQTMLKMGYTEEKEDGE